MRGLSLIGALALAGCAGLDASEPAPKPASAPAESATAQAAAPRDPGLAGGKPAAMMRAALAACAANRANLAPALAQFRDAGWRVTELAGRYQLAGQGAGGAVTGTLDPAGGGCDFSSAAVSIYEARAIGREVALDQYPGRASKQPGVCAGFALLDAGGKATLSYGGLDPNGACPDSQGASVLLRGAAG